jgi:probable HAF family extracellular repeat protein
VSQFFMMTGLTIPTRLRLSVSTMVTVFVLLISSRQANAQLYSATVITGLPKVYEIFAINNARTIVGSYTAPDMLQHAFSFNAGVITDLGTIPGGGFFNTAYAINNAGTIVGSAYSANGANHAFSYSNGKMTDLGTLGGPEGSSAVAVSSSGIVAGWSSTTISFGSHAFIYANGTMTDLGTLGDASETSRATGVNDLGTVVGWSLTATAAGKHAFSYSGGSMTSLGNFGGPTDISDTSEAVGVTNSGTIGGDAGGQGPSNSIFSYSNGVMNNFGALSANGATAVAMNSSGIIVGNSFTSFGHPGCFVTVNGIVTDLNTLVNLPGVTLENVICMSDLGDIIAYGESGPPYLLSVIPGGVAPTPMPTPTATPAPSPTPTPTPTPAPIQGSKSARLINISTRAQVGTDGNLLIPGFVVSGSGTETLLIRADGPSLTLFNVPGVLSQPTLSVFDGGQHLIASNTGWGTYSNPSQLAAVSAQVGAFAFQSNSADCALIVSLSPGQYTVQVSGVNNSTGVALAEIYEVATTGTRLENISARAQVGTGGNILIPGFVVAGSGTEQLLVRADGPGLSQFSVPGVLSAPSLGVFDSNAKMIASNTGWETASDPAQIATVGDRVGAFALVQGSADSAQIINLAPGSYTIQVSGVNSTTGVALAEIYEVP